MDIFMKILGGLIALFFIYSGTMMIFRRKRIIQYIQQRKYGQVAEPRQIEMTMSIIFGILVTLIGLYFLGVVVLSVIYPV